MWSKYDTVAALKVSIMCWGAKCSQDYFYCNDTPCDSLFSLTYNVLMQELTKSPSSWFTQTAKFQQLLVDKLLSLPAIGFALLCHLVPFAILSCDPTRCILRIPCDQVVLYSCSRISSCFLLLCLLLHSYLAPQLPQSPLRRMLSTFQDPLLFIPLLHIPYAHTSRFLWKSCTLSVPSLLKGCILCVPT